MKKSQAPRTLLYFVASVPNGRRNADFPLELGENEEVIFPPAKLTDAWIPSAVPLGVWIPMKNSRSNECWGWGERQDQRSRNRSKKGITKTWYVLYGRPWTLRQRECEGKKQLFQLNYQPLTTGTVSCVLWGWGRGSRSYHKCSRKSTQPTIIRRLK